MTTQVWRVLTGVALALSLNLAHGQTEVKGDGQKQAEKAGLTVAAVQAYISKKEKASATGVGSMHKSAAVVLESIRFAQPCKTTEKDRVVNGITGPMVYPARVKYTSNRVWGNGETEAKPIHYEYEFFKDSYGDWNAYHVGPVRE